MRVLLLIMMVVLAGCSAQVPEPATDAGEPEAAPVTDRWQVPLTGCTAVSGVSVYPRAQYSASAAAPPAPFVPADIREEIGDARVASANGAGWFTATGEVAGHWHTALQCDTMSWGFVGIRVEPPDFDDAPVDHNVLLAVWSWPSTMVQAMHPIGHATTAQDVRVIVDAARMDMLLDDAEHGVYQGTAPRGSPLAAHDAEVVRFWQLLPASGEHNHHDQEGPYRPIAFDMDMTAYGREVLVDSIGFFAHTGTDHHAPLPGLGGNDAAVAWSGFDATIRQGPRPDVSLNATWVH